MATTFETGTTVFSLRQRAVSLTLGIACTVPLTSAAALANGSPQFMPSASFGGGTAGAWSNAHTAAHTLHAGVSAGSFASMATQTQTTLVHNASLAAATQTASLQHTHGYLSNLPAANGGLFNLASAKLNFLAGNLGNFQTLTINVGGKQETVNLNTKLTAAEVVAVEQVLGGGAQTIKLSASGVANGGSVVLNNSLLNAVDTAVGGQVSSLTVAHGVQIVDNLSTLSLAGNLVNYGSILTAAANSGQTDNISANNVVNARGGSIASYTTDSSLYSADLNLSGQTSVVNAGSISANGNLNIATPSLTNSGSIVSAAGSVNLANNGAFALNGAGGTIQAANNVNISTNNADINVLNGNVLSQQVNFSAGAGNVNATLDKVTGVVNTQGYDVHITASTADLKLGNTDASGDPILVNTAGNVDISTLAAVSGQPYTIIASGNIISTANTTINTSSTTGDGGQVNLIAGATVKQTDGNYFVTKGSSTGGIIDLTGLNQNNSGSTGSVTAINTSSTNAGNSAGNIEMVAYAGKTVGSGTIFTTNTAITANGSDGGNVTLIAGAKTLNAISTGSITTNGAVSAYASTPTLTKTTKGVTGAEFDGSNSATGGALIANGFAPSKTFNAANLALGAIDAFVVNVGTGSNATVSAGTGNALNIGSAVVGKTGNLNVSVDSGLLNIQSATGGTTNIKTDTGLVFGNVNTTNLAVTTNTGDINLFTDVANFNYTSNGGNISIAQSVTKGTALALNLSGTETVGTGNLFVSSTGQINVAGLTTISGNTITLTASGKGGIAINSLLSVGTANSGSITLNDDGTGKLTELKGNVVSANAVVLSVPSESFGSKTAPFLTAETGTNASLTYHGGAKTTAYIGDQSLVNTSFNGDAGPVVAGSLILTSTSPQLSVNSANFTNVSVASTSTSAGTTGLILNNSLGNAAGTFVANSLTGIDGNSSNILGKTVTLTAVNSINNLNVSTPAVTATSTLGNINVGGLTATTVNGAANNGSFIFTDSAAGDAKTGNSLTVGKSVTGLNIDLSTTGTGNILLTGAVGNTATNSVSVTSAAAASTKGAVNGSNIDLTANGGNLLIGGVVGGLGSNTSLSTTATAPTANTLTVSGVVSGQNVDVSSSGQVFTTKAIQGLDAGSNVSVFGIGSATAPAVTIGGAVTGTNIDIGTQIFTAGNIVLNSTVGTLANTSTVTITAGNNFLVLLPGSITGKGAVSGVSVSLNAATSVGSASAPINTTGLNLAVDATTSAYVAQKGNVTLGDVTSPIFNMKSTGTLNVAGTVTVPALVLTSTGASSLSGTIDSGATGTVTFTSSGPFTAYAGSSIQGTGSVDTFKVTGNANLNGANTAGTFNLTASGVVNQAFGGSIDNANTTIVGTGGIIVGGTLGNSAANVTLTSNGAVQVGFPNQTATLEGNGTVTGASFTNYGLSEGSITYNVTGAGTASAPAFANYGTVGHTNNADTIALNVAKGVIFAGNGSSVDALNLSIVGGGNATVNLNGAGTTVVTAATVKGAFNVNAGSSPLNFGTAGTPVTAGSLNLVYTNASNTNTNTLTIGSVATTTGDLTIVSNAQTIDVGGGSSLTTKAGNITVQNTSGSASAQILFGDNVVVHGSGATSNLGQGNVSIFLGAKGYTPVVGTVPAGQALSGTTPGQIFFGSTANPTGSITVGTGDTLNSTGRNLSFNTGTLPASAITLGNNDSLTADPPVGAVLVTMPVVNNALTSQAVTSVAQASSTSQASFASPAIQAGAFNPSVVTATVNSIAPGAPAGLLSTNSNIVTAEQVVLDDALLVPGVKSKKGLSTPLQGGVSNVGHQALDRGPLLLSPEQDTVVDTPYGSVSVAAHSVTLVIASANGLSVYNLHDGHKNSVTVRSGDTTIALPPGRSAVLSINVKSFEEANQAPFVAYRRLVGKDLNLNGKLYQADFDVLSMLRGLPALKQLLNSTDGKQRSTVQSVLKTAAIMTQCGGASSEPYALYLTPSVTAYAAGAQQVQ